MGISPPLDPNNRKWEAIAAGSAMLILYVIAVARIWPQRNFLKNLAFKFLKGLRPSPSKAAITDPVERRILDECGRRHLQRADLVLVLLCFGYVGQIAFYLLNIFTAEPVVNFAQVLLFYPVAAVVALLTFFPRAITPKTVDTVYLLSTINFAAFTLLSDVDACRINEHRATVMSGCLFWGLFDLKPWLNAFSAVVIASSETFIMTMAGHSCLCVWASYSMVLLVLCGIHYILTDGVRLEILGEDSNNELTAMKTLLNGICDIIVQLDSSLRMKQHSPKLAGLLLQGPHRSLEGAELLSHMAAEEDRESFREHMTPPLEDFIHPRVEAVAHADVFHVRMRDSLGTVIAMEFFSVAFVGQDAQQHHVLGMREYTDIDPVVPVQRAPPPAVEVVMPRQRPAAVFAGTPASNDRADIRSHRSSSRHSGSERSHQGSGGGSGGGSVGGGRVGPFVGTKAFAKTITVHSMLMGWSIEPQPDACCPLHAALAHLQEVTPKLVACKCSQEFAPASKWQCPRCGVKDQEYKNPKRKKKCFLCEDTQTEQLDEYGRKPGPDRLHL